MHGAVSYIYIYIHRDTVAVMHGAVSYIYIYIYTYIETQLLSCMVQSLLSPPHIHKGHVAPLVSCDFISLDSASLRPLHML